MNSAAEQCYGFESNPVAPGLCAGCHEPKEDHPVRVTASVREVKHTVHVDLADAPPLKTAGGRRRKPVGLRIYYGIRQDVQRVDVTVEFRDSAELFPPSCEMPEWMSEIIAEHRPRDVDNPDDDRRTGMGGWPLPAPTPAPVTANEAADSLTIRDATPLWDQVNNALLRYGAYNPASSVPETERVFELFREHLRGLGAG
jgi:hypothetical protein